MDANHKRRWILDCLSHHNNAMFKTLLYDEHLVSHNLKYIEDFKREETGEMLNGMKGYFATKDMIKYWLDETYGGKKTLSLLPIKAGDSFDVITFREDVVYRVLTPTPFKITPEAKIPFREMVDGMAPFKHTNPEGWLLAKLIAISGYVAQDFVCVSTPSAFGKTAIYKALNYLTNKCPVYKPRSVPGALAQITGDGNMIFDEAQKCESKIREVMEDLSLRLADGSKDYINGALKSVLTKSVYDCHLQSVTYLYNTTNQYPNSEKDYFDVVWVNTGAMRDRFLQVKIDGRLDESFVKNFNIIGVSEANFKYYIDVAKTLLNLQRLKMRDGYKRRFVRKNYVPTKLTNRHRDTYDNITWVIDLYCYDDDDYNKLCGLLDSGINDYKNMISALLPQTETLVREEKIVVEEEFLDEVVLNE